MSTTNSRRDLRLRLEGCSTGEESEDEQTHPRPFDAFNISVKDERDPSAIVWLITCCVFVFQDTRTHVVVELYDTERSYVESLQTLVTVSLLNIT